MQHIKAKDLNLWKVFAALWRERNVTKAARALGMTQPALSRALGRLRLELSDPLFVRGAKGVAPTHRAVQIAEQAIGLVESLDGLYRAQARIEPRDFRRVLTIATSDYFEAIAARELIPALLAEAPGVTLNFRGGIGTIPKDAMEKGQVDLVIAGIYERLPEGFYHQKLLTDPYRSAVRKNHPLKRMTVNHFAQLPHVLVTPKGDIHGIVDEALRKKGKRRHIAIGTPNLLSAGWIVAHNDFVLSAPSRIIESLKSQVPLRDFPTPVAIPELHLYQLWHSRAHHDSAHKWLRQRISELFHDKRPGAMGPRGAKKIGRGDA